MLNLCLKVRQILLKSMVFGLVSLWCVGVCQAQELALEAGLHVVHSPEGNPLALAKRVVVLIHGINPSEATWASAQKILLERTELRPDLAVYLFVWKKSQALSHVREDLGGSLNEVINRHGATAKRIDLIAHSAGGVLLLQSLCGSEAKPKGCSFEGLKPELTKSVFFHTAASPHQGYGMSPMPSQFFSDTAITLFMGRRIVAPEPNLPKEAKLKVWYTRFENDTAMEKKSNYDMRFPKFEGHPPMESSIERVELPKSTHEEAVAEVVRRVRDIDGIEVGREELTSGEDSSSD